MTARPAARGVLYIVICGSRRAGRIAELVTRAQARDWDVCVVATPDALKFVDVAELEELTGHPVPHRFRQPDEGELLPRPDAIIVCPATFNTINKLALGISDTLALGILVETIGLGRPVVIAPALNAAQAAHWAFLRSVETLRQGGVTVLLGPGVYEPAPLGSTGRPFPWDSPLDAVEARVAGGSNQSG